MVQEWKKQKVKELKEELSKAEVVGIVDMMNLPARQLQDIKKAVGKGIALRMTKKKIIQRALDGSKYNTLKDRLGRMPAILLTQENPFKLYKLLKRNVVDAFAKSGDVLPVDVSVQAGPTEFAPGPIISEFSRFKVKTKMERGKISIVNDTVIAKKGEAVTPELASFLQKMGVKPMKIGMNLLVVQENEDIYDKAVLDIDEDAFLGKIMLASAHAMSLSVDAGIIIKDNVELLLAKASDEARNLAIDANILTKGLIGELLLKAENHALSLKSKIGG